MKNIGDKAGGLFDRKKKEMSDLAAEKAAEAQEALEKAKKDAGELLDQAGEF